MPEEIDPADVRNEQVRTLAATLFAKWAQFDDTPQELSEIAIKAIDTSSTFYAEWDRSGSSIF